MNKFTLTVGLLMLTSLVSCNRTDFTNPEEVIKSYRALTHENKHEKVYDEFLSSKSKEFVTKDEFLKDRYTPDSILSSRTLLESKVSGFPVDANNPSYRRFKVDEKSIYKKDTIYSRHYYSLINENGKWKVIWTNTLFSFARKKYADGNYSEARKTVDKIIEIDPFSGSAYGFLAWCFLRDKSLTNDEWENGVVKNVKYALALEEDNPSHYNTLASYYSSVDNTDLEIQSFERGLLHCQSKAQKLTFYANLVGTYASIGRFTKAEYYVKKAIEINENHPFTWYSYGVLMLQQDNKDRAIQYFEKALKLGKMENALQGGLYYRYSLSCFEMGKCDTAREYINKALDIEPDNYQYQALFNRVKLCK